MANRDGPDTPHAADDGDEFHDVDQEKRVYDTVYYDHRVGEFTLVGIEPHAEEVIFTDPFTGVRTGSMQLATFRGDNYVEDLHAVSPSVLRDPAEYATSLLHEAANAVSGGSTSFSSYFEPVDADFVSTAAMVSCDEDAWYRDRVRLEDSPDSDPDESNAAEGMRIGIAFREDQ